MKALKLTANWLFILTACVWTGPVFWWFLYRDRKDAGVKQTFAGEDWFWKVMA
jgi:hypothetical protein